MSKFQIRRIRMSLIFLAIVIGLSTADLRLAKATTPAAPSGNHPRLFMGAVPLAKFKIHVQDKGKAAQAMAARCQNTIEKPQSYITRGGADGDYWPGAAVACAFAYLTTQNSTYLSQAIKYWNAALSDDQTLGDGQGCVANVDTDWKTWAKSTSGRIPPVILTVAHDSGYPIRWYGPYIALTYDWLHDAPGVDEALRAHTRRCLTNWVDYYSQYGYHHDEVGANYNAGYVIAKTLAAIAFSGENGSDGDRLWSEVVDDVFGTLLIGTGLFGAQDPVGMPAGVLVGGDWAEGWQYGPLSVIEYAAAAHAMEEAGVPMPDMRTWANSLITHNLHATVPSGDRIFNSNGDIDSNLVYPAPSVNQLDAVLIGKSSDQAAAWAANEKQRLQLRGTSIWNALAEAREVTATDYRSQTPMAPLWYLARGTRTVFGRSSWDYTAYWAAFSSAPQVVSDHHHFCAGNFVFSRGGDHLIVDPSNYGEFGTFETNAPTVDSDVVTGKYAPSQTPWSQAELSWARGTSDGVVAARSNYAKAFNFASKPSDIGFALRDWVMLPEGEVVVIDRAATKDDTHKLYVNFHVNSTGTLTMDDGIARGTVGNSQVAIHTVAPIGAKPQITQPPVKNGYEYPCGNCSRGRFNVDNYGVTVPGPWAVAIHVIDGYSRAAPPPAVGSITDDNYDPAPKGNTEVIGAAIYSSTKQSYVLASSAVFGDAGSSLTYSVPGISAGRHVIFDAPEQADGQSTVAATVSGDRCIITVVAGVGLAGHPLMFSVGTISDQCKVSESTAVAPGLQPPNDDVGTIKSSGGCGCAHGRAANCGAAVALLLIFPFCRRKRRS